MIGETHRSFASWKTEKDVGTVALGHLTEYVQKLRRMPGLQKLILLRYPEESFKGTRKAL